LDEVDLRVLAALGERPLGSVSWLSERVGISPSTLSKRLSRLAEMNVLERRGFVSAQVCYSSVGLELVAAFMQAPPQRWMLIEEACDAHPYTRYRIRCMGAVNGIFAVFAVPSGTLCLLLQFLDALEREGTITNYHLQTPMNKWIYTEADFRLYEVQTSSWKFDWKRWEEFMEGGEYPPLQKQPPSVLSQMNRDDMRILRLLSIDARRERKRIAEEVGIPAYQLSRSLKFYRESQVVDAYRIVFGPLVLGLVAVAIFECKSSVEVTEKVAFAASKLPFQSTFVPTQSGFILYSTIPAADFPKLATVLQGHCSSVNIMWGDYSTSMRYWFDNEVSNFQENTWRADREFMVSDVLEKLKA